jgi:hypothetical protein
MASSPIWFNLPRLPTLANGVARVCTTSMSYLTKHPFYRS